MHHEFWQNENLDTPAYLLIVPHNANVAIVSPGEPLFGYRFDGIANFTDGDTGEYMEWLGLEPHGRLKPYGRWLE